MLKSHNDAMIKAMSSLFLEIKVLLYLKDHL